MDELRSHHHEPPNKDDSGERTERGLIAWFMANQTLLFAVAVSVFTHVAFLTIAAVMILDSVPAFATRDEDGEVPLAVIADTDLTELVEAGLAANVPTMDLDPQATLEAGEDFSAPVSDAELASLEMSDVGDFMGAGADDMSEGLESAMAGGGIANFFGVEARGSRFAYVVDISGSMADERIVALKAALANSIDGLLEHTHFTIVLYNSQAFSLTQNKWLPATDIWKRDIKREISAIHATGGTDPLPGFRLIFKMKPRPDAIYFMTDGEFPKEYAATIAQMNKHGFRQTPIHCITFIERQAESVMRSIARRSGGTYTHIEGDNE